MSYEVSTLILHMDSSVNRSCIVSVSTLSATVSVSWSFKLFECAFVQKKYSSIMKTILIFR